MVTPATATQIGGVKLQGILGGGTANTPAPPNGYITAEMLQQAYALQADLVAEVVRATGAEAGLVTAYKAAVQAEITARTEAIAEEAETRANVDSALESEIGELETNFTTLSSSFVTLNSVVDDATDDINVIQTQVNDLSSGVTSSISSLTSAIASETASRIGGDSSLQNQITTVSGQVTTEVSRAQAAENSKLAKSSNLSDIASVSTARANLGLGSAATQSSTSFDTAGSAAVVATDLGTEQARAEAAEALAARKAANLSDLASASAARTNLGLGSAATTSSTNYATAAALAAEISRAEAAEATKASTSDLSEYALASDLSGEISRAEGVEATLAVDSAVVHLSGAETITGAKDFTGSLEVSGEAVVVTNDSRLTDARPAADETVSDSSITTTGLTNAAISTTAAIATSKLDETAQTGIAGGNSAVQSVNGITGPAVTLTPANINAVDVNMFTMSGQIIAANGAGEYVVVTPGADGQILTSSSSSVGGVEWGNIGDLSGVQIGGDITGTNTDPVVSTVLGGQTPLTAFNNLSDLTSTTDALTNLGLGTAATANATDFDAAGSAATALATAQSTSLQAANNLSDLNSTSTARVNMGLGTAATNNTEDFDPAGSATSALNAAVAASLGLPLGLPGATAATRYVGGTTSGAPTEGDFNPGDFVIDQSGTVWVYNTEDTWVAPAGGGGGGPSVVDATGALAGQIPVASGSNTATFRNPLEIDPTAPPYNAKFDWIGTYGTITGGSNLLTISAHPVTSADVGKQVLVKGAGSSGASLVGYIQVDPAGSSNAYITSDKGGSTPLNASTGVTGHPLCFGSDDTTALNAAFAASAASNGQRVVRLPAGWSRFSQLVIPTGCVVKSAGWGSQWGVFAGPVTGTTTHGTLLQQLEGETSDAVIFTAQATNSTTSPTLAFIGPVDVDLGVLEGPYTTSGTQNGINCATTTLPGRPQDGFKLHDTQVIGFPGNAFNFPAGAVPILGFKNNRAFYNGGYGLSLTDSSAGVVQLVDIEMSGDANSLGLIYCTGIQHPTSSGLVKIKVKSEANSFSQLLGSPSLSHEWVPTNDIAQLNCITLDNCTNHFVIEADHISAAKDLVANPDGSVFYSPGALITLTGSVKPTIAWNATLRQNSSDTHTTTAFMINDTVNGVQIPRTVQSGVFGPIGTTYGTPMPNIVSASSAATLNISGLTDAAYVTALATAMNVTTNASSANYYEGHKLLLRIKDNGTAQSLTWAVTFASSGVATLPTSTVANKTITLGFAWNSTISKYVLLALDDTGY